MVSEKNVRTNPYLNQSVCMLFSSSMGTFLSLNVLKFVLPECCFNILSLSKVMKETFGDGPDIDLEMDYKIFQVSTIAH